MVTKKGRVVVWETIAEELSMNLFDVIRAVRINADQQCNCRTQGSKYTTHSSRPRMKSDIVLFETLKQLRCFSRGIVTKKHKTIWRRLFLRRRVRRRLFLGRRVRRGRWGRHVLRLNFTFTAQFGFETGSAYAPRTNRRCPLAVFFSARLANSHSQVGLTRKR
jgi:hypothetical protein